MSAKDLRKEKAIDLLHYWAYRHYAGRANIEQGAHATGGNPITSINPSKNYNPFCFKMKTNGKQDRPYSKSSIPLGHVMQTETNDRRAEAIDLLLSERFRPRTRMIVFYLFVPRVAFIDAFEGTERERQEKVAQLTDRKIAVAAGFCPKRASEAKVKAVNLVAVEILSPFSSECAVRTKVRRSVRNSNAL